MAIETFLHNLKCDLLKLLEDKVCTVTISPTSPLNLQCHIFLKKSFIGTLK